MNEAFSTSSNVHPLWNATRGLGGAGMGGITGYIAFVWLANQGFYAVALPGVLLGFGCGLLILRRSLPVAIVCGAAALALGLFAEWKHFPFIKDHSLAYFLTHLNELRGLSKILIALGTLGGFWFAWRGKRD